MFFKRPLRFLQFLWDTVSYCHHVLLPSCCTFCGCATSRHESICEPCRVDLPAMPAHCTQCGHFLPQLADSDTICGECLSSPPPYDRVFALCPYEAPLVNFIILLKFQGKLLHANTLSQLLRHKIQTNWYRSRPLPDLIIPIPLHASRLKERGYNQALEIAKPLAKALNISLDDQSCYRVKPTLAQSGLPGKARAINLRQAFRIDRSLHNLHVAVLDDVVTTGHTIREFCGALQQQGAKTIDVWCCARRG